MKELFQNALGVDSPWYIKDIEFTDKQLNIYIDFKRGSKFLNEEDGTLCGIHDTVNKTWRHLNFFQHECFLHARVPRIKKSNGKVKLISPPWAGKISGFTMLFEAFLIQFCKSMPVHNVSKLTGVSDYLIWRVLDLYVDEALSKEDLQDVANLGIDETSVAKGHNYITLFVDLLTRRTIHITDGKDSQTVDDFTKVLESKKGNPEQITNVSCDMSPAFIKGVREQLPKKRNLSLKR